MDNNAFAQTADSYVYVFNATGQKILVTVNQYPLFSLLGFGKESDFYYSPYGEGIPHLKDDKSKGFVNSGNLIVFENSQGSYISGSFSLPDSSVKNDLIMYLAFNHLYIQDLNGFILQTITITKQ